MKPFQTLPADHDNILIYSLHLEVVLGETQLFIFSVLQNFLNSARHYIIYSEQINNRLQLLVRFPDFFFVSLMQSLRRSLMSKVNFPKTIEMERD